jgi:hypothetical protein
MKLPAILPLCLFCGCTLNINPNVPSFPTAVTALGQKRTAQTAPAPPQLPMAQMSVSRPANDLLLVAVPANHTHQVIPASQIDAWTWYSIYTNRDNLILIVLTPPPKLPLPTRIR